MKETEILKQLLQLQIAIKNSSENAIEAKMKAADSIKAYSADAPLKLTNMLVDISNVFYADARLVQASLPTLDQQIASIRDLIKQNEQNDEWTS